MGRSPVFLFLSRDLKKAMLDMLLPPDPFLPPIPSSLSFAPKQDSDQIYGQEWEQERVRGWGDMRFFSGEICSREMEAVSLEGSCEMGKEKKCGKSAIVRQYFILHLSSHGNPITSLRR